jgi:acid stress-induced BolA-like protein IbaG/YrbA
MDLKDRIAGELAAALKPEYIRLEDDDGISGVVVSDKFAGVDALDRQEMIDQVLRRAKLTLPERRRVLMIAALTPKEYAAVGAKIRVHRVREVGGGYVEVLLRGGHSDAEYVRGAIKNQKGVRTTDPQSVEGAPGVLMAFRAKGSDASPLTRDRVVRVLGKDPYIEVMTSS